MTHAVLVRAKRIRRAMIVSVRTGRDPAALLKAIEDKPSTTKGPTHGPR